MAANQKKPGILDTRPVGHVLVPAAAIGTLSIILAAGLELLGSLDVIDGGFANWLAEGKPFPKDLPLWAVWLAAVFFAFGLSFALLSIPTTWRRVILWISALVVIIAWAPVLALAARPPEISAVLVAAVWSGVCALVYASRHRMACDEFPEKNSDEAR
ncbi:MAG: hypothetical protein WEB53_05785 [Akkermansiaceae bacterium]|jgi:hypothetical protein